MFTNQTFIKSVYSLKELPKVRLPEVILCGRSNVGKSSFINSLFNRKNLAKISSTPGKTRSVNYYSIDDKFYIVDLPGYGYAKASMKERKQWGKLVGDFIEKSNHIKLAFHIVDCRHEPSELDIQLNSLLNFYKIPYILILNKSDKLNQSGLAASKKQVSEIFPGLVFGNDLLFYSSVKKTGRKQVLKKLAELFE
jgi:GTP-binding protein